MKTRGLGGGCTRISVVLIVSVCCALVCRDTSGQPNSWTSPTSGSWEDLHWSLGVLPGSGQSIQFTNAGWKALAIGLNTAQNFPATLTVDSLTIASPTNSFNTLLLNYAGQANPLTASSMNVGRDSAVTLLSSALRVAGTLSIGGTFNQGEFSAVNVTNLHVGDIGPGTYNLTNGTLVVSGSAETLGGSGYPALFDQESGFHSAGGGLQVNSSGEYRLYDGVYGGTLFLNGGTIKQYGGRFDAGTSSPGSIGISGSYLLAGGTLSGGVGIKNGGVVQTGGTNLAGPLTLATTASGDVLGNGYYVLSNGVLNASSAVVGYLGVIEQWNGFQTITGLLRLPGIFLLVRPGFLVAGNFTLHGGMVSAGAIESYGTITQTGGTNQTGDLSVRNWTVSRYNLSGGLLTTSNTFLEGGEANIMQSGGRHVVGLLRIGFGAYGLGYGMSGGELIATDIQIDGGGVFDHSGGTVTHSGVLTLNPGYWEEETGGQQLGKLQLSGSGSVISTLSFPSTSCVIQFANSSALTWSNSAMLNVENWVGSIAGGGTHQLIFGNNSSALTAGQVSQIQFVYPEGQYPAQMLPSGEIVPDPTGTPFVPGAFTARGVTSNRIDLAWTEHSPNETGFKIERSTDGSNFVQIAIVDANITGYSDHDLPAITTFYYRVRAFGNEGDSAYTETAAATTRWGQQAPLPGMVGWWRGENTPEDAIGTNDGTIPYGMGYVPGEVGQAFEFTGQARRVSIPDSPDFLLTNGFTVEGWFVPFQLNSGMVCIRGDDRPGLDTWTLSMMNAPGDLGFQVGSASSNYVTITAQVQTNVWQHFAATWDKATGDLKLFLNGVLAAQTNSTVQPIGPLDPTREPAIGIGNSGGLFHEFPFAGLIDDVAIYSRALSSGEIQTIYNAGPAGKGQLVSSGPPALLGPTPLGNGTMRLTLVGQAGHTYGIQVSTNLFQWLPWTNVLNSSGTISITDGVAPNYPRRFYRSHLVP